MKSLTHSLFGAGALNCRFTLSLGHGAAGSWVVVLTALPRTAARSPMARIGRSTVQRATANPSRRSCRQTLRAPWAPKFSACARAISGRSLASRRARAEAREGSRRVATCAW